MERDDDRPDGPAEPSLPVPFDAPSRRVSAAEVEIDFPAATQRATSGLPHDATPEYAAVRPIRSRRGLALGLFVATCLSTFGVGTMTNYGSPNPLVDGFRYALSLMLILGAHELGHYLQARRYGVPASLPFFIPMPFNPFGTMGAVIFQGAGVANRKQLFDIAVSGPIAGLALALPITWFGLQDSRIGLVDRSDPNLMIYGDPPILRWMIERTHGPLAANEEAMFTPLLFAGWVGIFITALNLIPVGQLDGGHILYTLIGKRAHLVATLTLFGGIAYMVWTRNPSYALIFVLLFLMGPRHPPTADDRVPLGPLRQTIGWATLAFILVGFTPTPLVFPTSPASEPSRPAPTRPGPASSEPAQVERAPRFETPAAVVVPAR